MILLDVNVLLAAYREDHPHHRAVRPWFDVILADGTPFAIPDLVWASFVRIATNRRIFTVPTPLGDAFTFVRAVRAQPRHVFLGPTERTVQIFEEVCVESDSAGDLAMDAYLAALAIENGVALGSLDRDFARFPALTWRQPGDASRRGP